MEIKRDFYLDKLIKRKNNGLAKVITGIRRCSKSYLLNTLFYHHLLESGVSENHIIRFAFDSADDLYMIEENLIELEKKNRKANPEKLKNTFHTVKKSNITEATIKKYLDYFEDSFLMEAAQRYNIRGKAYIETPKKYYFSDLGLRNSRINFRQVEQTHMMENVLYNELRMRGYNVDVGVVTTAQKDANGKVIRKQLEVDFVCNAGSSRYYIQSAYTMPDLAKHEQEIRPFSKIDDSLRKILVTKDIVPFHYDEHGIIIMNIYDFLLDPAKLEH